MKFANAKVLDSRLINQLHRIVTDLNAALRWEASPEGIAYRKAEQERLALQQARNVEAQKAESEFYLEVKEALMAEGKAEHVANNLIRTEALLLEQARRLEII